MDMIKTNNAIQELIGFLRFDDENYKDLSINLIKTLSILPGSGTKK